jgi:hypothetical protein
MSLTQAALMGMISGAISTLILVIAFQVGKPAPAAMSLTCEKAIVDGRVKLLCE